MNDWDLLHSVVNDPNYFHGGPGTEQQYYGLYNVTFDRFLIVSPNLYQLVSVKNKYQYTIPTLVYYITENIDNSCCGSWTVETPDPLIHTNISHIFDSRLISVGPPGSVIKDYLKVQQDFLATYTKINHVLFCKS
jgi:hypothetical protein